jgi:hypothetical protein
VPWYGYHAHEVTTRIPMVVHGTQMAATRDLRPKETAKEITSETKGVGGRDSN